MKNCILGLGDCSLIGEPLRGTFRRMYGSVIGSTLGRTALDDHFSCHLSIESSLGNDIRNGSEGTGVLDEQRRWEGASGEEGIVRTVLMGHQDGHRLLARLKPRMCLRLDNDNLKPLKMLNKKVL